MIVYCESHAFHLAEKPEIKSSKKRKADAATESAADPKAAKQTRAITQQAQSVMIAELRTFHYAESSDFAKLTWEAFKKENPEVTYTTGIAH